MLQATDKKPVFTTSKPGFMGSTLDRNEEVIAALKKLCTPTEFCGFPASMLPAKLYIHGSLEREVGYDIPIWVGGTIEYKSGQRCLVYSVDGKVCHQAKLFLYMERSSYEPKTWKVSGIIVSPEYLVDDYLSFKSNQGVDWRPIQSYDIKPAEEGTNSIV